jgi:hypothetical protein
VLDVMNFATLSRVTEALDEFTFRHDRFKISVRVLGAIFLSCGHFPLNLLPIFTVFGFKSHKYRGSEQVQVWFKLFNSKNAFSRITQRYGKINCSGLS